MYSAESPMNHPTRNLLIFYDSLPAVILLGTRLRENYIGLASLNHNGRGWQEGQGQRQEWQGHGVEAEG